MKYSHDGLIYSYVLLLLHLSCWYYLTVRLPKWNFLFFEFEEIWGGFHENLHFLRRLEEIWGETSNLRRFEEAWQPWTSEIHNGEELWQWSRLEIRLNAFRRSTIPQKQFIYQTKKWLPRAMAAAQVAENHEDEWSWTWYLGWEDIHINSKLDPLTKLSTSSRSAKLKDILPLNISQMITTTVPISTRIVINCSMKRALPFQIEVESMKTETIKWLELPKGGKATV